MIQPDSSYSRPCCGKTTALVCLYWELFIGFSALVAVAWITIDYLDKETEEFKGIDECGELHFTCSLSNIDAINMSPVIFAKNHNLLGCQRYSFYGYILYTYISSPKNFKCRKKFTLNIFSMCC
jgi:hypothetical protein